MKSSEVIEQQEEDFEHWLFVMDDVLDRFLASLPGEVREACDYSPESLNSVEKWLLDSFASVEEAKKDSAKVKLDGAARYIGETFRKNLGGQWEIRFGDPSYAYFGLPLVAGIPNVQITVCPLVMATTAVDRQRGDMMSKNLLRKKKAQDEPSS